MFFISMFLVLMSCYNFFTTMTLDYDMLKYLNDAVLNSELLKKFIIHNNDYSGNLEWDIFIIDQIFIEKGLNVLDYEALYDSYENIGLKTMTYIDEWLINYSKNMNPDWAKIEKQIIEDITDAQQIIDEENSWYNRN